MCVSMCMRETPLPSTLGNKAHAADLHYHKSLLFDADYHMKEEPSPDINQHRTSPARSLIYREEAAGMG